jgi:hypothetical protein
VKRTRSNKKRRCLGGQASVNALEQETALFRWTGISHNSGVTPIRGSSTVPLDEYASMASVVSTTRMVMMIGDAAICRPSRTTRSLFHPKTNADGRIAQFWYCSGKVLPCGGGGGGLLESVIDSGKSVDIRQLSPANSLFKFMARNYSEGGLLTNAELPRQQQAPGTLARHVSAS